MIHAGRASSGENQERAGTPEQQARQIDIFHSSNNWFELLYGSPGMQILSGRRFARRLQP